MLHKKLYLYVELQIKINYNLLEGRLNEACVTKCDHANIPYIAF